MAEFSFSEEVACANEIVLKRPCNNLTGVYMRLRILALGVVLCVIGFILVVVGQVIVFSFANRAMSGYNSCNPDDPNYAQCMMQTAQQTSQNAISTAQIGTIITYVGGFTGFLGFVLVVVGAVLNPPAKRGEKAGVTAESTRGKREEKEEPEEGQEDAALTTLKVRYAKGEITKAQYDKIKKDLEE
jgi:uncharacterized membrane protein